MRDDPVGGAGQVECEATRALLGEPEAGLRLDEPAARTVGRHLARCAACRDLQAVSDPTVLFLQLRGGDLPDGFWTGFEEQLERRLDEPRFAWASLIRLPKLAYLTAPVMVVLALGVTMLALHPGIGGRRNREGIQTPFVPPGRSNPAAAENGGAPRLPLGAANPALPAGAAPGPGRSGRPALEQVSSPDARVYQFSVGAPGDETPIYLVVDESIDF